MFPTLEGSFSFNLIHDSQFCSWYHFNGNLMVSNNIATNIASFLQGIQFSQYSSLNRHMYIKPIFWHLQLVHIQFLSQLSGGCRLNKLSQDKTIMPTAKLCIMILLQQCLMSQSGRLVSMAYSTGGRIMYSNTRLACFGLAVSCIRKACLGLVLGHTVMAYISLAVGCTGKTHFGLVVGCTQP